MHVEVFGASLSVDETVVAQSPSELAAQIAAYERGDRTTFDLDVAFPADFTGRVMAAMAAIPFGETRTYGELAGDLDTAPVAVGGACGRNPIPIVVPCHRIVGHDSIGGFSADVDDPLAFKRRLLDHELSVSTDG